MKRKFLALSLCAVIGLSTIVFGACDQKVETYEIEVTSSSEIQGGSAHGRGSYKENTTVILTAVPIKENGFLAWVKNDEEIVSYQKEYSFIANKATEGKYTALFASGDNFDFAELSSVSYGILSFKTKNDAYDATISKFELSYNVEAADLYKPLATFEDVDLANDDDNLFDDLIDFNNKVFYFDKTYHFKLEINFKYLNNDTGKIENEPIIEKFSVNFSDLFGENAITSENKKTFANEKYELTLTTTETGAFSLNLDVNPQNSNTYWDVSTATIDYNIQHLSLTFDYPLSTNN